MRKQTIHLTLVKREMNRETWCDARDHYHLPWTMFLKFDFASLNLWMVGQGICPGLEVRALPVERKECFGPEEETCEL